MTATKCVEVNDVSVPIAAGTPFSFFGKHSNKTLSGIQLSFSTHTPQLIHNVEALFAEESVSVAGPFAQRSYQASIRMISSSYHQGHPERHYEAEVREVDMPPDVSAIEIGGQPYPVMKYIERDEDDEHVSWNVLLRLTSAQLEDVRALIAQSEQSRRIATVRVQRVGIDAQAQDHVIAGGYYWSKHEERDVVYYHQILRFVPPAVAKAQTDIGLASRQQVDSLMDLILSMFGRFEVLVNELARQGSIGEEQRQMLLGDEWMSHHDKTWQSKLEWQLMQVADAEESL